VLIPRHLNKGGYVTRLGYAIFKNNCAIKNNKIPVIRKAFNMQALHFKTRKRFIEKAKSKQEFLVSAWGDVARRLYPLIPLEATIGSHHK